MLLLPLASKVQLSKWLLLTSILSLLMKTALYFTFLDPCCRNWIQKQSTGCPEIIFVDQLQQTKTNTVNIFFTGTICICALFVWKEMLLLKFLNVFLNIVPKIHKFYSTHLHYTGENMKIKCEKWWQKMVISLIDLNDLILGTSINIFFDILYILERIWGRKSTSIKHCDVPKDTNATPKIKQTLKFNVHA